MALESACVALRMGVFLMMGLVQIREHLPFSVDSQHGLRLLRLISQTNCNATLMGCYGRSVQKIS